MGKFKFHPHLHLKFWVGVVLFVLNVLDGVSSSSGDILGCGGFVRSPHKLDFDKIEIKLFTKQGSLKLKTECAPTGYYFIPLENKGDYVLKISPPEGWSFEPTEVAIPFDGQTDPCSKGEDVNFDFKGFSVSGVVVSQGYKVGPPGIELTLSGPGGLDLKGITGSQGEFSFNSVPPGKYKLKGDHPSLKLSKGEFAFEIVNKNVVVENQLVVTGYDLSGSVQSDGAPVSKVSIVLLSEDETTVASCAKNEEGQLNLPKDLKGRVLCVVASDSTGSFKFGPLRPGTYTVVPVYKGANIVYNVNPDRLEFVLGHNSAELPVSFEVQGFSVNGRVKGAVGAKILVNGIQRATSGHDGSFTIGKMKPGSYEFEVVAENFLFEKKQLSISPTSASLGEFVPWKFLTCGTMSLRQPGPVTLSILFTPPKGEAIKEDMTLTSNSDPVCVYLPQGSYTVGVVGGGRYFLPQSSPLVVPSGSRASFTFSEFSGSISGSLDCAFTPCKGLKLLLENAEGNIVDTQTLSSDTFIFSNLGSGSYRVRLNSDAFCWASDISPLIQLKNVNVEGVTFIQNGLPLEIYSSHSTSLEIGSKAYDVEGGVTMSKICLKDIKSGDKIVPKGCSHFPQKEYELKQKLDLIAVGHDHSWIIRAPRKINDLKVTRNGESFDLQQLQKGVAKVQLRESVEPSSGFVIYEIISTESPGELVEWSVFSYGFIFEPSSFFVDTLDRCQARHTSVDAKASHVIRGKFTPPLEGVSITIQLLDDSSSAPIVVTSDAAGNYIAGPFVINSSTPPKFSVLPSLSGYSFKPLTSDPYSFSVAQLSRISVSVESAEGPLSGVLLSLSGPNGYRQNKASDATGSITFNDLTPGEYYLKALLKEYSFSPPAKTIPLGEQEGKELKLVATRESFSLYGELRSLAGDRASSSGLLVAASGLGNCSEYGEEATSDDDGRFRIWGLKSYCSYRIRLVNSGEYSTRVERTIPEELEIKIGTEDIMSASFVVLSPVRRLDVSLRVSTNNEKALDSLKAIILDAEGDTLHVSPFNGQSYIILPPIPLGDSYTIRFESSLNKYQYSYELPSEIKITTSKPYAHFTTSFNIAPAPGGDELGGNSMLVLALFIVVLVAAGNFDKVSNWAKELVEKFANGGPPKTKKTK